MREHDDGGGRAKVVPELLEQAKSTPEQTPNPSPPIDEESLQPAKLYNPFASTAMLSFSLVLFCLMSLWVITQLAHFFQSLMSWPPLFQFPALVLVGLLFYLIAKHSLELWLGFRKMRTQRQLSLKDLDDLDHRKQLQLQSQQQYRKQLSSYLKAYPLSQSHFRKNLAKVGFNDQHLQKLEQAQHQLLEKEWGDSEQWLVYYRENFQRVLDSVANERIRKSSLKIGIASASCPHAALDFFIVLAGSLQLNADLCQVYQLKLGRIGLWGLLYQSFRHSFIALNLEDVSDHLMDQWSHQWSEHISSLASTAMKFLGTRLAEGGANALLISRLGHAAKRQLQALR